MHKQQRSAAARFVIDHVADAGVQHFGGENGGGNGIRERRFAKRTQPVLKGEDNRPYETGPQSHAEQFLTASRGHGYYSDTFW